MNHTVRLINANAVDGIQEVIGANQWVDCIITNFNMDYFYEDTLDETFNNVVCNMKAVLACDGSIYIGVKVSDMPFVSNVFEKCGFILKNILTIPLNNSKTPCRPTKYIDEDLKYFLFLTQIECICCCLAMFFVELQLLQCQSYLVLVYLLYLIAFDY